MTGSLSILDAVILGIVEGITEFLPVSSTGHLVLAQSLLGLDRPELVRSSVSALLIVMQGGAILAVLSLYRARVMQMIRGLCGKDAAGARLLRNLFIAFLPAAILGPLADDWVESRLMRPFPILLALAAGGVVMIIASRRHARREQSDHAGEDLTAAQALQIGLLQCLAMWPGTSRSMVTILGGMFVGMRPARSAEFAFLLGLPTLGGACVYKLGKNLMADGPDMFEVLGWAPIVVGLVVATVSAMLAIGWLVSWLNRHGLEAFGWYRLALTALLVVLLARGWISIGPDDVDADQPPEAVACEVARPTVPSAWTSS